MDIYRMCNLYRASYFYRMRDFDGMPYRDHRGNICRGANRDRMGDVDHFSNINGVRDIYRVCNVYYPTDIDGVPNHDWIPKTDRSADYDGVAYTHGASNSYWAANCHRTADSCWSSYRDGARNGGRLRDYRAARNYDFIASAVGCGKCGART